MIHYQALFSQYLLVLRPETRRSLTIFNKIFSKPESDLGSPETENIEIKEVGTEEKIPTNEKPATEETSSTE